MADKQLRVWVVDDDSSQRWVLERALGGAGMQVRCFAGAGDFLERIDASDADLLPDVVVSDVKMPGMSGYELLEKLRANHPKLPVILITAHTDLDAAVTAYKGGAFEYLPKPFDIDEAIALVERAASANGNMHRSRPSESEAMAGLIGTASAMQTVFRTIGRLSNSSATVLITGESGTGKELIARALYENSPRASASFVALNTSAIAPELLESEFFGHEKGAFTGAEQRHLGHFEQANGGTLFLDEIGDMPGALQTRLLRVLAEGEFYRVGGRKPVRVDVRVIAATHQDLESAMDGGSFRRDLFHRLNVIGIQIPPLRERREDIPLLLEHYLAQAAEQTRLEHKVLSEQARDHLCEFDWPGNVRQLVNVCQQLIVATPGSEIRIDDLPAELSPSVGDDTERLIWTSALSQWAYRKLRQATPGDQLLDRACLLYTSPSPRDLSTSRMPSSA